ncbi:hypothetical protein [uncultured Mailhella sp.]|uniref:hypothetical protein n=1 Tax=uncultured Mailhella sp. TaxID=1981031 RepID=UPI0025F09FA2|nr:hypothetical protein [uncultured Mailhella sp.]
MEEMIMEVCGSYAGLVLSLMGVCAAVAALLPAPSEKSGAVYRVLYRLLNLLAVNVGRARNADDAAQEKKV